MTRFELSIHSDYVPTWGAYEGIREVVQNGLDGQADGYPMTIDHDGKHTLTVASAGAQLDRSVWLMGKTSKSGGNHIGCHGEGLKVGCLALIRAGRKVVIRNGTEDWHISLQESRAFPGQQVLTVSPRKSRTPGADFTVQIECSTEEWADYQRNFLALMPELQQIETRWANILLDPSLKGRIYVKGIFIEEKENCSYGWNFLQADTDRDRRMISSFDFSYGAAQAIQGAWGNDDRMDNETVLDLLQSGGLDAEGLGRHYIPTAMKIAVGATFKRIHGEKAVPVMSSSQATEVGHMGRYGVIVSKAAFGFFEGHPDLDIAILRATCKAEIVRTYGLEDLNPIERAVYDMGGGLVDVAGSSLGFEPLRNRLSIVDFRTDDVLGIHKSEPDESACQISIARSTLQSLETFLQILVHELAHDKGGDGDVRHERAEGELFSRIIARSLQGYVPTPSAA